MNGATGWTRRVIFAAPLLSFAPLAAAPLRGNWVRTIRAAPSEGAVRIYSTLPDAVWPAISDAFATACPGIKVQPERISSIAGIFERYAHESAARQPTADLLIASSTDDWQPLSRAGKLLLFDPPDAAGLPHWTERPDRFTMSIEPQSFICHRGEAAPRGLHDLAQRAAANPSDFAGRITGYDPFGSSFGYSVLKALAVRGGERFWHDLEILAPHLRLEVAAPGMIAKIAAGAYRIGLYLPETFVPAGSETLQVVRPDDGVPVFPRTMAVPREAAHPNAAKVLIDFLLSKTGQGVLATHGVMAYRPGVARATGKETFETLQKAVGVLPIPVIESPTIARERVAFDARLRHTLASRRE
jgi:iron(III) transport system substrate-binding protein